MHRGHVEQRTSVVRTSLLVLLFLGGVGGLASAEEGNNEAIDSLRQAVKTEQKTKEDAKIWEDDILLLKEIVKEIDRIKSNQTSDVSTNLNNLADLKSMILDNSPKVCGFHKTKVVSNHVDLLLRQLRLNQSQPVSKLLEATFPPESVHDTSSEVERALRHALAIDGACMILEKQAVPAASTSATSTNSGLFSVKKNPTAVDTANPNESDSAFITPCPVPEVGEPVVVGGTSTSCCPRCYRRFEDADGFACIPESSGMQGGNAIGMNPPFSAPIPLTPSYSCSPGCAMPWQVHQRGVCHVGAR